MRFTGSQLALRNRETEAAFELQAANLERFGVYLSSSEAEIAATFEVSV